MGGVTRRWPSEDRCDLETEGVRREGAKMRCLRSGNACGTSCDVGDGFTADTAELVPSCGRGKSHGVAEAVSMAAEGPGAEQANSEHGDACLDALNAPGQGEVSSVSRNGGAGCALQMPPPTVCALWSPTMPVAYPPGKASGKGAMRGLRVASAHPYPGVSLVSLRRECEAQGAPV